MTRRCTARCGRRSTGWTPMAACRRTTPCCCWPAVRPGSARSGRIRSLLTAACDDLARQLMHDAEGATKAISIQVVGADSEEDAVAVGRAVARSNLFKCAITGRTRTGAGYSPPSAPRARRLTQISSTSRSTASGCARTVRRLSPDRPWTLGQRRDRHRRPVRWADGGDVRTTDLSAAYVHENSAYST